MTVVYGVDAGYELFSDATSNWIRQARLTSSRAIVAYGTDAGSPTFQSQVAFALIDTSGVIPTVIDSARTDVDATDASYFHLAAVSSTLAVLSASSDAAWLTVDATGDSLSVTNHADPTWGGASSFNLASPPSVNSGRLVRLVRRRPSQYVYAVQVWEFGPAPSLVDELVLTTSASSGLWNPRMVVWDSADSFLAFTDDSYPDIEVVKFTVAGGAIVSDGTDVADSSGDYYWLGNIYPPISPVLLNDGRVLWGALKISTDGGTELFHYSRSDGAASTGVVLGSPDGTYAHPFDYYHAAAMSDDGIVLIYSHAPDMTTSFVLWRDGAVTYGETDLLPALTEPSFIIGGEMVVTAVGPGKWLVSRMSPVSPPEQDSRILYLRVPPLRQNQRDDIRQGQRTSRQLTVRQVGYL